MANLEFYEQHNMVAFLKKPHGSTDFHQIVDFLNSTHFKYALTENPVIYVSLIRQFWETTSSNTFENGEIKIIATIDGRVKFVTKASIRRAFKGYSGVDVPLFPTMLVQGPILQKDEHDLEDPSKQGRKITQIDEDERITLVQMGVQTQGRNEHEVESDFDFTIAEDISTANVPVTTAGVEISTASPEDKTAKTSDDSDDITLAETLIEIRRSSTKPQKVKGVAFRDMEENPRLIRSTTTLQPLPSMDPKDKDKDVLVEE
nr:hypothetical protein [Tanacetum cinerariifolium]